MPNSRPQIVWLREDLRLHDNPALTAAAETGAPVVCLYILEEGNTGPRALGGASKWWLHKSLEMLSADIAARGGRLILRRGDALKILLDIASGLGASSVFWNRRYDAGGIEADKTIKAALKQAGLDAKSLNGRLLTEPWAIKSQSGSYYRVFTPYWRAVRAEYRPPTPRPAPDRLAAPDLASDKLEDWDLEPTSPDWASRFSEIWTPGEAGAAARLEAFLNGPVNTYGEDRNRPDLEGATSGLSPHLRWGEISPAQVWRAVEGRISAGTISESSAWKFLSELVWREFSYVLLYHNPALAEENYNKDFRQMPWRSSQDDLSAWQRGQTGYPIVDAGMRQLWTHGWMHNRVRMVAASFLTKHLLIPWQTGEDWFWDTLVDADPAANAASWQWVAGSGADAAPYFRVFNPITQGEKFDVTGGYVRQWCPELAELPDKYLFSPWQAPPDLLDKAGIQLGETYPHPIIDHREGRERALAAYDQVKSLREAS